LRQSLADYSFGFLLLSSFIVKFWPVRQQYPYGLRNEMYPLLKWLHRLVQCSHFFWKAIEKTSAFWNTGVREDALKPLH
jgi:hypothetical protein